MSSTQRPHSSPPPKSSGSEGYYTWGLVFVALALLSMLIFDEPPAQYIGAIFAVPALVLGVIQVVRVRNENRR